MCGVFVCFDTASYTLRDLVLPEAEKAGNRKELPYPRAIIQLVNLLLIFMVIFC